jgi:hypothetical protein
LDEKKGGGNRTMKENGENDLGHADAHLHQHPLTSLTIKDLVLDPPELPLNGRKSTYTKDSPLKPPRHNPQDISLPRLSHNSKDVLVRYSKNNYHKLNEFLANKEPPKEIIHGHRLSTNQKTHKANQIPLAPRMSEISIVSDPQQSLSSTTENPVGDTAKEVSINTSFAHMEKLVRAPSIKKKINNEIKDKRTIVDLEKCISPTSILSQLPRDSTSSIGM